MARTDPARTGRLGKARIGVARQALRGMSGKGTLRSGLARQASCGGFWLRVARRGMAG